MARDRFHGRRSDLIEPLEAVERSTHTSADFLLACTSRCITCSADGTLVVDTPIQTNQTIQVFKGWNPIRITKIVKAGSDPITVDCWD